MKIKAMIFNSLLLLTAIISGSAHSSSPPYEVGVAITDITGPSGEVQFGGYVDFAQLGQGIYMRQFARSFIIKANDGDPLSNERFVLVETDLPMQSAGVYAAVINRLKAKYGDLYTEANVNIAATHTHAAPGGYFKTYMLNALAGLTYYDDYFHKIVNGIVDSIDTAHNSLSPGRVFLNSGEFSFEQNTSGQYSPNYRVNQNRSPEAYYLNKDIEDYLLPDGGINPDNGSRYDDTNRQLVQLKFVKNDRAIGIYNWTPVHPHVSGPKKRLVNGDSFGLAAYLLEQPSGASYATDELFVAAFAMADSGDLTANITDDALLFNDVANNGEKFQADGIHDYQRMAFRAKTIVALSDSLSNGQGVELTGKIESRQMFVPARNFPIKAEFINENQIYYSQELGETVANRSTCDGAVGLGQLAGSIQDAPGLLEDEGHARDILDYSSATLAGLFSDPLVTVLKVLAQATTDSNELIDEMDCELEKTIAISLSSADAIIPNGKAYNTVFPVSILKIDNFAVLSLPVEVATMPGRRLKAEVMKAMPDVNLVAINANSNAYDSYIVTREEYALQQYEGGSNIFGPYSLNAIRQWTHELAESFQNGHDKPDYAVSFDAFQSQLETTSLVPSVIGHVLFDDKPLTKPFGDVITQPASGYDVGQVASAVFWGAHPNNNLSVNSNESYLVIEKQGAVEEVCHQEPIFWWTTTVCETVTQWQPIAYDYDTSTRYIWNRDGVSFSKVTIEWHIPPATAPGDYRIRHVGQWKSGWSGAISRYEGISNAFNVSY